MKLTQEIIKLIETQTNCGITESDNVYYVCVDNHCGQDFSLEINKSDGEVEDIIKQCENYDPEEEFRVWYGANNGEPTNPRTLLDNCDKIGENLAELKTLLKDTDLETFCEIYLSYSEININDALEITQAGYTEVYSVFDSEKEAARDYLIDKLGHDFDMLEDYIDLDGFFEDVMLESEGYMRLDSGRIVSCE